MSRNTSTPFSVKRTLALPAASFINWLNQAFPGLGLVLKVPGWRHDFPSWTRDIRSRTIVSTVHGFDLICDSSDFVGRHIILDKDWEPLIAKTITACVRPGGLCLDIGANAGFHTMLMGLGVGASGRVIAFEPDMQNLRTLIENIALNGLHHVAVSSLALSDTATLMEMSINSSINRGASNLREPVVQGVSQPVLVMPGDSMPLMGGYESINVLKIDVEGLEDRVLRGLKEHLANADFVLCEMSPAWLDVDGIHAFMKELGFQYVAAEPLTAQHWVSPEVRPIEGQHDVLFYRAMVPELSALIEFCSG